MMLFDTIRIVMSLLIHFVMTNFPTKVPNFVYADVVAAMITNMEAFMSM